MPPGLTHSAADTPGPTVTALAAACTAVDAMCRNDATPVQHCVIIVVIIFYIILLARSLFFSFSFHADFSSSLANWRCVVNCFAIEWAGSPRHAHYPAL